MKKTLLVPTDFSENAKCAMNYAVSLAKKGGYKILLINGFEVFYPTSEIPIPLVTEKVSDSQRKAEEKLAVMCKQITRTSKIKCNYIAKEATATNVILETAKTTNPDFIVMGTKGANGVKELLFGSNTSKVIEKAKCPVIAIPKKVIFKGGDILFSTNYHDSDIDALKETAKIASQLKSRIILFHVAESELTEETEKDMMDDFISMACKKIKYNKLVPCLEFDKTPGKALQNYIKTKKPGMVVMSTRQRSILDKIFNSSITKKLAHHTKIPLLAFHYKKE